MSDKRLLSADELTAMKIMAWGEFSPRDQNQLWDHIDALERKIEKDARKVALANELDQAMFSASTSRMSLGDWYYRATAEEKDES